MSIVDLEEAKAHLNVTFDNDDELIELQLDAAENQIDRLLGYEMATLSPVPDALRQAVLMLAAHYYANREAVTVGVSAQELPAGVWDIVSGYRNYWSENA